MIFGVYNSQFPEKNLSSLHALVDNFKILEFSKQAATIYGKVKAQLKSQGKLISDNDLLIGSHALSLKLPLITNNNKEYSRITGLVLENWV
jgi:tRNA(fMet)-specific endonuclease VapC